MQRFLRLHFHPLGGRIIFWNLALLVFVKLILPQSAFQWASLVESIPVFDSRDIITMTNEVRSINHLPSLKANSKLDLAASEKLNDMAIKEYFAHTSPDGTTPWYWVKDSQYQYSIAGENLAIGFISAQDTVQAWMNSPSHKANLLNNKYQDIGVAVKGVSIDGRQGVLVVQMFGKPLNSIVTSMPTSAPAPAKPVIVASQTKINVVPEAKGETISVAQEISTDSSIKSVDKPTSVPFADTENAKKIASGLNNVYTIYSTLIAIISASAFFFLDRTRKMGLKTTLNLAIFMLAIILPVAKISFEGLIF